MGASTMTVSAIRAPISSAMKRATNHGEIAAKPPTSSTSAAGTSHARRDPVSNHRDEIRLPIPVKSNRENSVTVTE